VLHYLLLKLNTLQLVVGVHKAYGLNNSEVILVLTCLKFHYYVSTPVPLILQRIEFNIQGLNILKFVITSLETMLVMVIVKFSLLVLKISLLIFLQNHLIKRDLTSFEMNLGLLISNLWINQFMLNGLLANFITWQFYKFLY